MAAVPNVSSAYYMLEKVTAQATTYYYDKAPGLRLDPALNAAHHFLLGTFAGPRAPDVVASFRENTIGDQHPAAHGDHGGLNWGAQHVPLIFSGPGVASGTVLHFPARLIDIAPTILRVMGLSARPMDGIVLADALSNATVTDTAAQAALSPSLTAHQLSFIQQSNDNIAEDAQAKLSPPQPLTPKP
jgi:hypothetical protein